MTQIPQALQNAQDKYKERLANNLLGPFKFDPWNLEYYCRKESTFNDTKKMNDAFVKKDNYEGAFQMVFTRILDSDGKRQFRGGEIEKILRTSVDQQELMQLANDIGEIIIDEVENEAEVKDGENLE